MGLYLELLASSFEENGPQLVEFGIIKHFISLRKRSFKAEGDFLPIPEDFRAFAKYIEIRSLNIRDATLKEYYFIGVGYSSIA